MIIIISPSLCGSPRYACIRIFELHWRACPAVARKRKYVRKQIGDSVRPHSATHLDPSSRFVLPHSVISTSLTMLPTLGDTLPLASGNGPSSTLRFEPATGNPYISPSTHGDIMMTRTQVSDEEATVGQPRHVHISWTRWSSATFPPLGCGSIIAHILTQPMTFKQIGRRTGPSKTMRSKRSRHQRRHQSSLSQPFATPRLVS